MRNLAEETIQLPISTKKVYKLLSSIKNYKKLLKEHTKDWKFEDDICSFIYDGSTFTQLKMYENIPNEKIVIGTFGKNSIDFDMELLFFDLEKKGTNFKITIKADMNPIMASMASSSMDELQKHFVQGLKRELGLPCEEEKKK